jgi:hypothetical protein
MKRDGIESQSGLAGVAKLADAPALGAGGLSSWGFESLRPHFFFCARIPPPAFPPSVAHVFGPTICSRMATLRRCETVRFR